MSIQLSLADSGVSRGRARSGLSVVVRSQRIPLLVKVVAWVYLYLTMLVFGVLMVARLGTIPELLDPPQAYLPGSTLPQRVKGTDCFQPEYRYVSCRTEISGRNAYVLYDPSTRMIIHTAIEGGEHKIGDLVAAWGFPTGFDQQGGSIFIYWGTRTAILYTTSFKPDTRLTFIEYDFEQQHASPWHGFVSSKPVE